MLVRLDAIATADVGGLAGVETMAFCKTAEGFNNLVPREEKRKDERALGTSLRFKVYYAIHGRPLNLTSSTSLSTRRLLSF